MVKSDTILLHILLTVSAVQLANSIHTGEVKKDFMNIGNFDERDYFISPNSATWNNAVLDCRNQFGGNGHLVAIESKEKWEFLREALERHGYGFGIPPHWTSGMFDPLSSIWRWTNNDEPIGPFPPWDIGQPRAVNEPVLFHHTDWSNVSLMTSPTTFLNRYICEVSVIS